MKNKKPAQSKKSIDQIATRNTELEGMLKRTLADYQNLERRIEEERKMLFKLSSLLLIEKLLPVVDNLENAQAHLKDEGLALVLKQFKDVLSEEGVTEIQTENQTFDPTLHEAADVAEGSEEGKIVKVIAKGYKIDDKVVRPAKVVVAKKKVQDTEEIPQSADQILDRVEKGPIGGET